MSIELHTELANAVPTKKKEYIDKYSRGIISKGQDRHTGTQGSGDRKGGLPPHNLDKTTKVGRVALWVEIIESTTPDDPEISPNNQVTDSDTPREYHTSTPYKPGNSPEDREHHFEEIDDLDRPNEFAQELQVSLRDARNHVARSYDVTLDPEAIDLDSSEYISGFNITTHR